MTTIIVIGFFLILSNIWVGRKIEKAFERGIATVLLTKTVRTDIDELILTIVRGWKQTHPHLTQTDEKIVRRLQELGMYAVAIDGEFELKVRNGISGNTNAATDISRIEESAMQTLWEAKTKDERPPARRRDCIPPPDTSDKG